MATLKELLTALSKIRSLLRLAEKLNVNFPSFEIVNTSCVRIKGTNEYFDFVVYDNLVDHLDSAFRAGDEIIAYLESIIESYKEAKKLLLPYMIAKGLRVTMNLMKLKAYLIAYALKRTRERPATIWLPVKQFPFLRLYARHLREAIKEGKEEPEVFFCDKDNEVLRRKCIDYAWILEIDPFWREVYPDGNGFALVLKENAFYFQCSTYAQVANKVMKFLDALIERGFISLEG